MQLLMAFVYSWDQNVIFECHLSISCMPLDCLHLHPNPWCSSYGYIKLGQFKTWEGSSIHSSQLYRMSLINLISEWNPTWMSLNRMSAMYLNSYVHTDPTETSILYCWCLISTFTEVNLKIDADPFTVRLPWTSYSSLIEKSLSTADTYLEVFLNYARRGAFEVCKLVLL